MDRDLALPADLLPVPAALITFRTADGRVQVVPATWTAIVGTAPATLSVALASTWAGEEPAAGAPFAVNLPAADLLDSPSFLRQLPFALCGDEAGVPLIEGCPVQIECREGAIQAGSGRALLRGEVAAVSMEGVRYRSPSPATLFQLRPFARVRRPSPAPVPART